ncbi:MAG TPA: TIGR03790 family protein [Bryobacteraceae bacterium]|nr:TIGR03790 family protein [Bryobacteraceae bacterium]
MDLLKPLLFAVAVAPLLQGQTGSQVLLVVNRNNADSVALAAYYRPRRSIPLRNVCFLAGTSDEEVSWDVYRREIETPVADCLRKAGLQESVLYIVLTMGVPLKVTGAGGGTEAEYASVDSELSLLYAKLHGRAFPRAGGIPNPFFQRRNEPFRHPRFPIYLVTRLAGFDLAEAKQMVDRSLAARNRGKFVIDLGLGNQEGDNWLRDAALLLPGGRVVLEQTPAVLYDARDVIGYAAWGSNDSHRRRRGLDFQWLPGAIAMEFVSTDARTLKRPPDNWSFTDWQDKQHWFGGSPQSLSADYIHQGATAATGNTYEPFLGACARPDYLLPAYFGGRNLAESYYLSIPLLSWQGVLLGDPLCALGKP